MERLFGFETNILISLLVLTGFLRFVLRMPDEVVFDRILPACGLMLCTSTLYYAGSPISSPRRAAATM